MNVLDVEPHVRFTLPATNHQIIHLLRAGPRALQNTALCDTFDDLLIASEKIRMSSSFEFATVVLSLGDLVFFVT